MEQLILPLVVVGSLWLWARRRPVGEPPEPPEPPESRESPAIDLRPPATPSRPVASVHLVFVEFDDQTLLLDCVLAEPYGAVPAGQTFTIVVRLPVAIAPHLAVVFERWAAEGCTVELRVDLDQHGPRARFHVDGTHVRLEILASSPLRGVDGRG